MILMFHVLRRGAATTFFCCHKIILMVIWNDFRRRRDHFLCWSRNALCFFREVSPKFPLLTFTNANVSPVGILIHISCTLFTQIFAT